MFSCDVSLPDGSIIPVVNILTRGMFYLDKQKDIKIQGEEFILIL